MSISTLLENWSVYRHDHPVEDKGIPDWEAYPSEIKWAMAIDLDACTGCNACSVACYAENNLPVVGKEKYLHGQAMHWMRIERYWDAQEYTSDYPEQGTKFLPMLCQQCGAATCEPVCPVAATYHTPDGLNAQVYNRCIGSRYCSNNCPYRVRYFNMWSYYDTWPEPLNMQLNPDLSVRDKGVMEKCTFCIQRIRNGKDKAQRENRPLKDHDILTACQQACPTNAIVFGDTMDPESEVSKMWAEHEIRRGPITRRIEKDDKEIRGYRIFDELNMDPSIMYLERVRDAEV